MWTIRPLLPRKLEEKPAKPFVVIEFLAQTRFGNRIVFKTAPLMNVLIEPAHEELGNARAVLF
jgi:hypothetical protein